MVSSSEEFKKRTKAFGLRILRLAASLPESVPAQVIGKQLVRSATSVGANYRAACRARSRAEFCAKMGIVEEEANESVYWLELRIESCIVPANQLLNLLEEGNSTVAMVVSSIVTARTKLQARKP
jgi:four helix bundle protein